MTIISTGTSIFADAPAHRVYTRARWGDAWVQQAYLYCDELEYCAAPALSSATLRWVYGEGMPAGATGFAKYTPLTPEGRYVKIEVDENGPASLVWYGRVLETPEERRGAYTDALGNRVLSGVQTLRCVGLEYDLAREPLRASVVRTAAGGDQVVLRPLAFNGDERGEAQANMSSVVGGLGVRSFAADLKTAAAWNAREILEYLLVVHPPRDSGGQTVVPWRLDTSVSLAHLEAHRPVVPTAGRTLKDLLDELVGRDRMSGYRVVVDEPSGAVWIRSFTFNDVGITLPDGSVIPANANPKSFDFDQAFDITLAAFSTTIVNQFEQVVVRGARRGSVCTLSTKLGTLEADWTASQQSEYNNPTANISGYGGLTDDEKKLRVANYRRSDTLAAVYSRFRLAESWDGKVHAADGVTLRAVFPSIDESTGDPDPANPMNFWRPGLRLERYLPLREGVDYSTSLAGVDANPAGTAGGVLPAIALLKIDADRYQHAEKLAARPDLGDGLDFACDLHMADGSAGLWLTVSGGPQHKIAEGVWTAIDATVDDVEADLDYRDDLVATVYVLSDEHVEVRWPVDSQVPALDHPRRLVIDLADAHLDYLVPDTVVAVKDGALVRNAAGGFLPARDDRARLAAVARLAWEWHAIERKALVLSYRQVLRVAEVGDMVIQIGAAGTQESIRTVVTRVHYNLARGETSIQTEHVELAAPLLAQSAGPAPAAGTPRSRPARRGRPAVTDVLGDPGDASLIA